MELSDADSMRLAGTIPIRVQTDRPVLSVGVQFEGNGTNCAFSLDTLDNTHLLWGKDYVSNLLPGEYSIINISINDWDRRAFMYDCLVPFTV